MSIKKLCLFWFMVLIGFLKSYACKPQINWSPTVSFCAGNSLVLSAPNPNSTYLWNTGAVTPSITVTSSGTYYLTVTNVCGSTSDTITVYVDSPLNINLGPDRAMCSGNNPTLSVPFQPSATYRWQDNSTSHQMPVTHSGTYHVKVTNACGSYYDTVSIVLDNPLNVNLGADINNCTGTIDTIGFPSGQKGKIFWNTGDTTNSIVVSAPGIYWVKMSNGCGTFRDTIRVDHRKGDNLNIGDTINKCAAGSAVLSCNIPGLNLLWSNNATSRTITVTSPGMYWLRYTDNCGVFYDTAYVLNTGKARVNLGADTTICAYDVFYLNAGNAGSSYTWSTGVASRTMKVDTSGTYWVGVNNGCGVVYDSITVDITPVPQNKIGDTAYFCGSGYVDADAGDWGPTSYYFWDDGFNGRVNRYASRGSHWVMVGNHCDTVLVNFYVKQMQMGILDLGPDTTLCGPLFLDTHLPDRIHDFEWSDGSKLPHNLIQNTGLYWVKVTNACGVFTDSIFVNVVNPPGIVSPKYVRICNGSPTTLLALPNDTFTTYRWSNQASTNSITVNQPGVYHLTAYNICDTIHDTVVVSKDFPINVDLGPDTIICQPDVLYLNVASYGADSVRWSTGSRNGGLPILTTGTYWVKLYNACGVFIDTIHVEVRKKPSSKLKDLAFCIGDSVTVNAYDSNVNTYLWNTGSVTPSIVVNKEGWYWVSMTNYCGTTTDSVYVRQDLPIPPLDLGKDTIFCVGTLWLDPGLIPGVTYKWQDGTNARRHLAQVSGTYWVKASNTCNTQSDSITVLITGPPKLILGDSVRFCHGSIFTFNAQNPGCTYQWNTGATGQYLSTDTAGKYWVTIHNDCGTLTDTVELITEFPLVNLELGHDTIICKGETLELDADYSHVHTLWSTGSTNRTITVNKTGTYSVEIWNSCGVWEDSIHVEVQDVPIFWLGKDSVICNLDGSVYLKGPPGMDVYEWNNGDTGVAVTFNTPGKKWLRVANKCFEYTDTIILVGEDPIEMDLGQDTTLCFGESLQLSPGAINYPITWYNGLRGSQREVTRSGTYWASARNSCGIFYDTIQVHFDYPLNPGVSDTLVCRGDSAIVDLRNTKVDIEWFDGSTNKYRGFAQDGVYTAAIINKCGTFYKDFKVDLSNCNCPLFVANSFTPNGDGLNDEFGPVHSCDITDYELVIFNRWGIKIFEAHTPGQTWDGTVDGQPAPIGVYNYQLNYGWMVYGVDRARVKRGIVTIIR